MRYAGSLLLACLSCVSAYADDMHRGANLTLWYNDIDANHMPLLHQSLDQFKAAGGDEVAVNVWWYQDNKNSTVIQPGGNSASDALVNATIDAIQARGMKVDLRPHVNCSNGDPNSQIPGGATWFNNTNGYRNFINHYAAIAAAQNVDLFCVGAELTTTAGQGTNWGHVIDDVRAQNYTGKLTYSAIWGNPAIADGVTWWDKVDYIGIDAYYPLTTTFAPTPQQLKAAWADRAAKIGDWWNALPTNQRKPILFTEAGYTGRDGTNTNPASWNTSTTLDLQEQADCYDAMFSQLWGKQPWFNGVNIWNWEVYPNPPAGYFMPQGMPAGEVMKGYYTVPEPGALLLLVIAGLSLLGHVWRKQR